MRTSRVFVSVRYFYTFFQKWGDNLAVDGSLIFDTKIDTDGVIKGEKDISSKMINIMSKMAETQKKAKALRNELAAMSGTTIKTKAAEKLETDIEKTTDKLNGLKAKLQGMTSEKQQWAISGELDDVMLKSLETRKAMRELEESGQTASLEYRALCESMKVYVDRIADLNKKLDDLERNDELTKQSSEYKKLQEQIQLTEKQLKDYENELKQVEAAAPRAEDTAAYKQKEAALEQLSLEFAKYEAQLHEAEQAEQAEADKTSSASRNTSNFKKHLQGTISALKMFGRGAAKAGSLLKSAFSKSAGRLIQSIGNRFKKANNQTNVLEKSLKRIKNTLVRMFFFRLVHSPIDAIKDGLGEIAKISPALNKNLSALKTESTYLKNSLAALAAPLVNLVTPAFVSFMQTISGVLNKTGQLLAVLTGQSGFTQAVKVQQDYAESLDESTKSTEKNTKATKENQKALAGFDELNVLDVSEEDSDDSSEAASPMYEEVEAQVGGLAKTLLDALKKQDFDAIGKLFGDKINSALKKINWKKIKKTIKSWATNIADFLNGFVKELDWSLVGSTIGNGIDTALLFSLTFLTRFNWKEFGKSLAKFINSAAKAIDWKNVGKTIAAGLNAWIFGTNGFVSNLDWYGIGTAFHTALKEAFENVKWGTLVDTLALGINGLVEMAIAFVGEPDFGELGKNTAKSLKDFISKINWGEITNLFSTLLIGSLDFLDGFVIEINWKEFGKKLADSFNSFFGSGGGGREFIEKVGKTLGDITRGIADFIIGVFQDKETSDTFSDAVADFFKQIPWVELIVKSITGGLEIGAWLINTATNLVEKFCKGLATAFDDSKNDPELSKAVKNLGISLINLLITVFESGLKILVNGIPNLLLGALKVVLGALSWLVKFVLGDDWYNQAISSMENWKADWSVKLPRVPYLATGTVIPANYGEFLAVLGDNKREPEVVSPISDIKQALLEALAERGDSGGDQPQEINLYIDGDKFFTWLIGKNNRYQKSHGQSAFKEVRA